VGPFTPPYLKSGAQRRYDPVHLENAVNTYLRQHSGRLRAEAKSILQVRITP